METENGSKLLPNGCRLYWRRNSAGGRTYISNEVGEVAGVWDTSIIDESTLLAAMTQEAALRRFEFHRGEYARKERSSEGGGGQRADQEDDGGDGRKDKGEIHAL